MKVQERFTQHFFLKHKGRLEDFIARKVNDPHDVEEIFQETMIAAFESFHCFSAQSSLFTWLCGIAKHEIADYYRKKKIKTLLFSHFPWLEELASQALGPEQKLLRNEFEGKVRKTLMSLSEGYQEVLRLKYYEDLSVKEIAQKLNETVKTVESRLFRARKNFAQTFAANPS